MIKKEKKLIVTFYTTSAAMAMENACKEKAIEGSLISAPRELTADCGISYATSVECREKIESLLKEKKIEFDRIVEIEV